MLATGALGGIGGEVVRAFIREGCRVVAHYGQHGERAEVLARWNWATIASPTPT